MLDEEESYEECMQNNDVFNELIDYFCSREEYEKCAELKKIKESKKYKKNFINL